MSKIHLLDEQTIDSIAAGEVVERPASVVKELVENSIDSGADSVTVEIRKGGKALIRVTDNGCGIEPDEAELAFMRHATSKLREISDLTKIDSLGFRGEALSSIAAVSRIELITRTKENLTGVRFRMEGGQESELSEIGAPYGTTILVRDLFYNTPVRAGFLKSDLAEKNAITSFMEQLALSHPGISFNYTADGRQVLFTSGSGDLLECAYRIFGRDITRLLIPADCETDLLKVRGYLGLPALSRGTRNFENYYINGRYVKDKIIASAIEEAYKGHLMQQRFPFTLLDIEIDRQKVDVNVHPSKMEVRFSEQSRVYEDLRDVLAGVLLKNEEIPELELSSVSHKTDTLSRTAEASPEAAGEVLQGANAEKDYPSLSMTDSVQKPEEIKMPRAPQPFETKRFERENIRKQSDLMPELVREKQLSIFDDKENGIEPVFTVIGQAFGTYILIEYKNTLYIIDQHAAHEKVMYEKYMKDLSSKQVSTQFLMPAKLITLTAAENDLFAGNLTLFEELGFVIEHFEGREWKISGVPANLYIADSEAFFTDLLDSLSEAGSSAMLPDRIAAKACKAAVKGNSSLSGEEIRALIRDLLKLDDPYHCPHGRPTMISMTHYELDKKFKRIV